MALIYSATGSLDGYVAAPDGSFEFAHPDAELHAFVNDVFRRARTILIGRRSYELMDPWDTLDLDDGQLPEEEIAFARQWRETDKIVYSTTLTQVRHPRTRLESTFDPAAIRALTDASDRDLMIGGSVLAGAAFRAGIVDEVWTFLVPTVIGGGLPMFAPGARAHLDLINQRRFGNGTVGLHYRVTTHGADS